MKNRLKVKDILLIFATTILVSSVIIRDNYYLNIATIISSCFIFFVLKVFEPVKSMLIDKRLSLPSLLSIILNLGIITAFPCLFVFSSSTLTIIFMFLLLLDMSLEILSKNKLS